MANGNAIMSARELRLKVRVTLAASQALAVVRANDGAMRAVQAAQHGTAHPYSVPFLEHMGRIPSPAQIAQIAQNITNAVAEADILGVSPFSWGLFGASRKFFVALPHKGTLCSTDFPLEWLRSGAMREVVAHARKLFYIGCHELPFLERFSNLKSVEWLRIPAQWQYFMREAVEMPPHYPDVFDEAMNSIAKMDLSGTLCLVGAGWIGKPYVIASRDRGGVAVDIGSVMDRLAGFRTRGVSGVRRDDEEFKL